MKEVRPPVTRITARLRWLSVSVAVVLAGAGAVCPAWAGASAPARQQAQTPANGVAPQTNAGSTPGNAELERFARALVAIGNIKRAARPGIAGASSQADRKRLEQAAAKEIKAAIRSNHLSVHRYLQIVAFVQTHTAAQKKLIALLKQLPIPPPPPYQPLP